MTRCGPTQQIVLFTTRNGGDPLVWLTVHAHAVRLFFSTGSPIRIFSARTLSVGTKKPSGWLHAAQNQSLNGVLFVPDFPELRPEPVHREWRREEPFGLPDSRAPQQQCASHSAGADGGAMAREPKNCLAESIREATRQAGGGVSRWELSKFGSGEDCDGATAKGGAVHGVSLTAVEELSE